MRLCCQLNERACFVGVFFVVTGMRVFVWKIEWRGASLCSSASWFLFCVIFGVFERLNSFF